MMLNIVITDGVIETFADILIGGLVYFVLLVITKDTMLMSFLKKAKKFVKRGVNK